MHVGGILSLSATFGIAVVAVAQDNPHWLLASGSAFFLWTVLSLVHLAEAPSARCAVCTAPLFERTTCAKHRKASKTLGGYRLDTALLSRCDGLTLHKTFSGSILGQGRL